MPLRPICHLEEEEGKAEEAREEEVEAKIEVEETVQQMLKEGATIQISIKDKGMINPMSNVTIVKNMDIMQMNVGRSSMIWVIEQMQISLEKILAKINCF